MKLELYRRFVESERAQEADGRFMPYGWGGMPNRLYMIWMTYSVMLDEFARELANGVNAFTRNVQRLKTWAELLPTFEDEERHEALFEFIDPIATLALLSPYMLRSRFIFATAHLCHQVNLIREKGWSETSLPLDNEIWFDAADKQGKPWRKYGNLKLRLEKIASKSLGASTADFRNAFSHRFSARIGLGLTNFAERKVSAGTGFTTYAFGGTEPLAPAEITTVLTKELHRCYAAFEAFQELVAEHRTFILPNNAELLAGMAGGGPD